MVLYALFSLALLGFGIYGLLYTPYINLFVAMFIIGLVTTLVMVIISISLLAGYCLSEGFSCACDDYV